MATAKDDGRPALPWSLAWRRAALAPGGFYRDGPGAALGPACFFRTSVHVGRVFHAALARLLIEVDDRLGRPARLDVVDVGAGRGELLAGLLAALPDEVARRVHGVGVDVHGPPSGLDARIEWHAGEAPDAVPDGLHGLVIAHEWLDDVPLDVVEIDERGVPRLVLVDTGGHESLGPALDDRDGWARWGLDATRAREWLERWWPSVLPGPGATTGERAELGHTRDDAWRSTTGRLVRGTALAVDYGHERGARHDTLTGHALGGRPARPVPDGTMNITAHVAVDSLADAVGARVRRQRESLLDLGVSAALPDRRVAAHDPSAYAVRLEATSDARELLDPSGLGRFAWVRLDR